MTLALLCQFTAQHVSDVSTSIFRSLRLLGALLCRLYCADLRRGIGCWWCGIRVQTEPVVQPTLGYHITNIQSRYITPTRLKSAPYSLHNNAPSSRKLLKMDVLTSETCWAVNWHDKASFIKSVYLYSNRGRVIITLEKTPLEEQTGSLMAAVYSAGWTTSGSACTRIPHHQQPIPLHNTNTPQVSTIQPTQ